MRAWMIGLAITAASMFAGCDWFSPNRVRLPHGDAGAGRAAFVELKCSSCHEVEGEDFPPPMANPPVPRLGGAVYGVHMVPTDVELFTAIMDPSHRIKTGEKGTRSTAEDSNESRMGDYTRTMTVRQLMDIVAYLHSAHKIKTNPYPGVH